MKMITYFSQSSSPSTQPARNPRRTASLSLRHRLLHGKPRRNNTVKESDSETGLYYFEARYLDPKASRWLSGDPALGEYLPSAPVNDEARKRNGSLPGMGGVFNYVNLHVYHYAGNNPVKYVDPDGNYLINNVAQGARSAREFAQQQGTTFYSSDNYFGVYVGAFVFYAEHTSANLPSPVGSVRLNRIVLPGNMNNILTYAIAVKNSETQETRSRITADAIDMGNERYEIQITVSISGRRNITETIAFAGAREIMTDGIKDQSKVDRIANDIINITLNQRMDTQNIDRRD